MTKACDDMKCVHVNIYGRVQGVGFRYFALRTALVHGVKGYVKNEIDGSVTLVAQAEERQLEKFLKAIEVGNGFMHVDCMSIEDNNESYKGFEVIY